MKAFQRPPSTAYKPEIIFTFQVKVFSEKQTAKPQG